MADNSKRARSRSGWGRFWLNRQAAHGPEMARALDLVTARFKPSTRKLRARSRRPAKSEEKRRRRDDTHRSSGGAAACRAAKRTQGCREPAPVAPDRRRWPCRAHEHRAHNDEDREPDRRGTEPAMARARATASDHSVRCHGKRRAGHQHNAHQILADPGCRRRTAGAQIAAPNADARRLRARRSASPRGRACCAPMEAESFHDPPLWGGPLSAGGPSGWPFLEGCRTIGGRSPVAFGPSIAPAVLAVAIGLAGQSTCDGDGEGVEGEQSISPGARRPHSGRRAADHRRHRLHCPAPNYINHHDHDDHDHDNDDIDHHDVDPDDPTHYAGDTADDVAHNSERSCDDDDGSVTSSLPHGGTAGEAQRDSSWHGQEQYVIPAAGTISSGWEREGGWSFSCERSVVVGFCGGDVRSHCSPCCLGLSHASRNVCHGSMRMESRMARIWVMSSGGESGDQVAWITRRLPLTLRIQSSSTWRGA